MGMVRTEWQLDIQRWIFEVNTYLGSGDQKASVDARKDTLINKTGLAAFSLSEKNVANKGEG